MRLLPVSEGRHQLAVNDSNPIPRFEENRDFILNTENILFIVDAMRPEIYSDIELKAAQGSYSDIMRRYFIEAAMENGYEVIYMEPIFINRNHKDGSRFDFETDGHWNALGHKLVAEAIQSSDVYARTFDMQ